MDVNHHQERDQLELLAANAIAWTSFVRRHAHVQPVDVALRSDGHGVTYKELDARFDRIAAAFSRLGVSVGGRVGILMANRTEYIEALGGIMRLGAIAVPLNFRLVAAEVAHLLHDSGATLLVADADRADIAREAVAVTGDATPVVVVGDARPHPGPGTGGPRFSTMLRLPCRFPRTPWRRGNRRRRPPSCTHRGRRDGRRGRC